MFEPVSSVLAAAHVTFLLHRARLSRKVGVPAQQPKDNFTDSNYDIIIGSNTITVHQITSTTDNSASYNIIKILTYNAI